MKNAAFYELVRLRGHAVLHKPVGIQIHTAPGVFRQRRLQRQNTAQPVGALLQIGVILRNDVCDISLNLQLTERVLVSTDGGISTVEAEPEPDEPEEMWRVKRE